MGKISKALFSSNRDDWETPKHIFDAYAAGVTLDVCATNENSKCLYYFDTNALEQDWDEDFWMNPPYGRRVKHWVKKAHDESRKHNVIGICLLPARTDTRWFHDYIYKEADEIIFLKGRIRFLIDGVVSKHAAPFPSMIVIF